MLMAEHYAPKSLKRYAGWIALLLLAALPARLSADIFADILARVPQKPPSYVQIIEHLQALAQNPRCTVKCLGNSAGGRPLMMVEVTDPTSTCRKATLFIIAVQHGNEPAGAAASLALLDQFAAAPTSLEQNILKYLRLVVVPVANPDGYTANRRYNGNNADLNRDWISLIQPETQAINHAVHVVKPDAIMDLHELPAVSNRATYAENFLETEGMCASLPRGLCRETTSISSAIASWMRTFGYPLNVYFDYPGDSLALAHRHFGLGEHYPTFLCESKQGVGRPLPERAGFHILSALVIANHIMNDGHAGGMTGQTPAPAPPGETPSLPGTTGGTPAPQEVAPATPPVPPQVQVALGSGADKHRAKLQVTVTGAPDFEYLTISVGGRMKALGNSPVSSWPLDFGSLPVGEHTVTVTAFGPGDTELASADFAVRVTENSVLDAH
jgi:hypothetical protein